MIIIACIDDNLGMMFNKRRQSRDSAITKKICDMTKSSTLWIKECSETLFEENENIRVDSECIKKARVGEYCFVEDEDCAEAEANAEKLVLFKWNRKYPADLYFKIDVSKGWRLEESFDFEGSSHEKITAQIYVRS